MLALGNNATPTIVQRLMMNTLAPIGMLRVAFQLLTLPF